MSTGIVVGNNYRSLDSQTADACLWRAIFFFSNQQTFDCWKMCFGRHHQLAAVCGAASSNLVEAEMTLRA